MQKFLMAVTLVLLWLFLYDYADSKELPKEMSMKTVGDKLEAFALTGVRPGQPKDAFFDITEKSYEGVSHSGFVQRDDQGEAYFIYPGLAPVYGVLRLLQRLLGLRLRSYIYPRLPHMRALLR